MAKGKATKATKAKSGSKPAAATKPKPKAAAPAPTSVKVKSTVDAKAAKTAVKPAPAPAAPVAAAAAAGTPGISPKKKNVKRGAPPMLPRRMARRPEPGAPPAGPPGPPRLVTQPGSLHAPARAPEGAESLKQHLSTVMGLLAQLRALKRTLNRQFFEAGLILQKLSEPVLYQAKGYGSFDKFIEREIERELAIGRQTAHDLVQIVKLFQRAPAEDLGLDRLKSALRALWPEPGPQTASSSGPAHSG